MKEWASTGLRLANHRQAPERRHLRARAVEHRRRDRQRQRRVGATQPLAHRVLDGGAGHLEPPRPGRTHGRVLRDGAGSRCDDRDGQARAIRMKTPLH